MHLLTNQVLSIALYLWRKNVQEELRISQAFRTFFFHLASTSRHDSSQRGNTIMMCFPKHIKFWKICKLQVNAKLASHIRQNKYVQMRHNLDDFQNPKKWTLTGFEKEPINRVYCGPLLWSQNFFWGNTSCFLKMIQNSEMDFRPLEVVLGWSVGCCYNLSIGCWPRAPTSPGDWQTLQILHPGNLF